MGDRPLQRNLVLILARNFASHLATSVFLVDAEGTVIYYNEAAEHALGRRFIEGHGMPLEEWSSAFRPKAPDGQPLSLEEIPLGRSIVKREPAHGRVAIRGADGVDRTIEVTSFPLFAHADDFVGAIAIFWVMDGEVGA
jgi:PAS domain-containing protein